MRAVFFVTWKNPACQYDSSQERKEIMYELVEIRKDEIFTNSKVIAEGTGNKHHAIQQLILKYEKSITRFGAVAFEMRVLKHENGKGSTQEKIYFLNEGQATFLMTLMRNDGEGGIVVEFKARLVEEFIKMRDFIEKKKKTAWNQTRIANKENRIKETDVIKLLAEYAKEQGSKNSDKLYMVYTKLAKTVVGDERDSLNVNQLNNLTLAEHIILKTIRDDMVREIPYKEIYKDCKERINQFMEITYLAG